MMKSIITMLGLLISITAAAECVDGGKHFRTGEKDCNGFVCGSDGKFTGMGSYTACNNDNKEAEGCYAYGKSYGPGESDCDGRVCQHDGTWYGVVKSGVCDVTDEQGDGRDPASVKHKKKKHSKKKKAHK